MEDIKIRSENLETENARLLQNTKNLEDRTSTALISLQTELKEVTDQYAHFETFSNTLQNTNEQLRNEIELIKDQLSETRKLLVQEVN